jgi:penicillin-insensitive murein endopeptidase
VRLDIAREWQLTRALLTDGRIEVLWMFVSRDVEALLLQQAVALDEPAWIVWRAQQVMHQPRDSATHDDHMHLRIACAAAERPLGCEGGGPYWPWFDSIGSQEDLDTVLLQVAALDEPIDQNAGWLTSNGTETKTQ